MTNQTKPRYEFIDLMKGICILMVVMNHSHIDWICNNKLLILFRMPLYYIISGMFFKTYESFSVFSLKKINSLIIPTFTTLIFYNGIKTLDNFMAGKGLQFFFEMHAMWFLISLFQVSIIYFFIKLVNNKTAETILSILISLSGYLLYYNQIHLPYFIDTSLSAVIYYHFGQVLKSTNVLQNQSRKDNVVRLFIWLTLFLAIGLLFNIEKLSMYKNIYPNNYIVTISLGISGTMIVLYFSKLFKKMPVISYIGRYSIIVLCFHYLYLKILIHILNYIESPHKEYISFLATIVFMFPTIFLVKKYVPFLFAQQSLFDTIRISKLYRKVVSVAISR